ncbi:MAG: hypothetical protein FWE53_04565 [Firmicutes bacterium]|nr:hypothetical protein [Bacillota bacterium]
MDNAALAKYVGLAIKAGYVVFGIDNIKTLKNLKNTAVILCPSASENLKKNAVRLETEGCRLIRLDGISIDELIKTTNCKLLCVVNTELSKVIISL